MPHRRKEDRLFWIAILIAVIIALVALVKAAWSDDYGMHQLCAEGKLTSLQISKELDLGFFNPRTEELHKAVRPFYAETMQGGKKVTGCVPAGIYVAAKRGNMYAEHFAVKGWRDIMNVVPISLIAEQTAPEKKKIDLLLPQTTRERTERVERQKDFLKEPPQSSKALNITLTAGNCVSAIAVGWGVESKNEMAGMVGVSTLVVDYAIDWAYGNGISFGDVLATAVCGAVGAMVAPKPKDDKQSPARNSGGGPTNPPN